MDQCCVVFYIFGHQSLHIVLLRVHIIELSTFVMADSIPFGKSNVFHPRNKNIA